MSGGCFGLQPLSRVRLSATRGLQHARLPWPSLSLWVCSYSCPLGLPDSSVGKESACNAGDPGSIPGSGRSAGEGIGYPLQYSWASLVAQLVKNLPSIWETWVWSLGWEDPLEKGKATHSSILAGEFQGLSRTQYCKELDSLGFFQPSVSHDVLCI